MIVAPLPPDEEERLAALAEYQILDTAAESIFDKITSVASIICGVPICLISLIDRDRQWFKSNIGMADAKEGPRDDAFCAHAILDSTLMEVPDATKDERFFDNPFVLENPNIRFYAGMPLINPRGFKLGTLCVIDREPKVLTYSQKEVLENLSQIIIHFFEIKKSILMDINQRKIAAEALASANYKLKKKLVEQKQNRQELLLLSEMSSVLQACMNAEEAYIAITKFCRQLFPDTEGVLYLVNATHDHIDRVAAWGDKAEQEDFFALDECWALRRGQVHHVIDTKVDLICKHMAVYEKTPSYMCLPLMAQGEILGLLNLEFLKTESDKQLSETQRLLAIAMAEQVGLSLANAKLRETLHQQSVRDPLTGLYNRRYLTETLKRDLPKYQKKQISVAFLLIDIDYFKQFNDTYGHDAGDMVLTHTAHILAAYAKNKGHACRFGGEEFIVVLENVSESEAKEHAEIIRKNIQSESLKYKDVVLNPITLSIGVAVYPKHGECIEELFKAADSALYQAKETGRNKVVVKN
jgi:diguanylate cyclase (GGDEF)-like protein